MADPALGEAPAERRSAPVTPLPAARPPPPAPRPRWGRRLARLVLLFAVPAIAVLVGAHYWMIGGRFVATDNAYIRADKVAVAAEVSGRVTEVAVSTNQTVSMGAVLFRIDQEPYRIALDQSEAELDMVRTEIAVLRAQYWEAYEHLVLAETDAAFYEQEYRRQRQLAERNVAAVAKVDRARHEMDMALQAVAVRGREMGQILARLGGNPAAVDEGFARFKAARTRRDRAALRLRNTVVTAPADGIIGRVNVRPGTFVEPGVPVISLVETADLWIEANLKESELTHVALGQTASVRVDAYPAHVWRARVVSFSPATGAEFSLLPAQNATGNWVKVVQRVPVRLRIEPRPDDPPLRLGMSTRVSIDTGHQREVPAVMRAAFAALPDFVLAALAWLPAGE